MLILFNYKNCEKITTKFQTSNSKDVKKKSFLDEELSKKEVQNFI